MSVLGWDLHAHLVPSVDDGVRTVDEAIDAIVGMQSLGYSGCVVTPHIYQDVHPNDTPGLLTHFDELKCEVRNRGIDFGLVLSRNISLTCISSTLSKLGLCCRSGRRRPRTYLSSSPTSVSPLAGLIFFPSWPGRGIPPRDCSS